MDELIRANNLSKTIAGKTLFKHAIFKIYTDDCIGIIGPNGCGKTTLFRILSQQLQPDDGDLWIRDHLRVRMLQQTNEAMQHLSVQQFISDFSDNNIQEKIEAYEKQLENPSIYSTTQYEELLEHIQKLRVSLNQESGKARFQAILNILNEVSLGHLSLHENISVLSGGEQQKLALASALAQPENCDLLLLDEPTNHLDIETIEWLEDKLVDLPCTVLIISHDEYLLDDLVDRVFDFQGCNIEIYDTSYKEYLEQHRLRQHTKFQEYRKTQIQIKKQRTSIQKISRRNRYDTQIASKLKRLEKISYIENPILKNYLMRFHFTTVVKSGKNIADGKNIAKRFEDKIIFDSAEFEILSGQKIGLIGPNGCGKTTFLKILTGEQPIDQGILQVSRGVHSGYFDQGQISLTYSNTLVEEILRDHEDLKESDAKALLGQFNFKHETVFKKIAQLSGGERARIALLRLLMQPYNFLILDEPTNHMDTQSKKAIVSALNSYNGTVLIVSHDRQFLDDVVDTIFLIDTYAIRTYAGNYSMFKHQRLKEESDISGKNLGYLSKVGLKKYHVERSFTEWTTRTRYKRGEYVYIGDHNEHLYESAIKNGSIAPCRK